MNIKIDKHGIKLLSAIALFAGKKDIRYYLNGVHFELLDGVLRIVATNGHFAATAVLARNIDGPNFKATLATEHIVTLCKNKNGIDLNIEPSSIGLTIFNFGYTRAMAVEGKYPEWHRVVTESNSPEKIGYYDATLLATIAKASIVSGFNKNGFYSLSQRGTNAAPFYFGPISGIVMPLRMPEFDNASFLKNL